MSGIPPPQHRRCSGDVVGRGGVVCGAVMSGGGIGEERGSRVAGHVAAGHDAGVDLLDCSFSKVVEESTSVRTLVPQKTIYHGRDEGAHFAVHKAVRLSIWRRRCDQRPRVDCLLYKYRLRASLRHDATSGEVSHGFSC